MAGKTGTAQHTDGKKQDDSVFVAITHPDQPQYVVLTVVEEGGFGASVAAPVFGLSGDVIGAISACGPRYRLTAEFAERIAPKVTAAAAQISHRMGWRGA